MHLSSQGDRLIDRQWACDSLKLIQKNTCCMWPHLREGLMCRLLPVIIEHTIDERSPLIGHTFDSLVAVSHLAVPLWEAIARNVWPDAASASPDDKATRSSQWPYSNAEVMILTAQCQLWMRVQGSL